MAFFMPPSHSSEISGDVAIRTQDLILAGNVVAILLMCVIALIIYLVYRERRRR